MAIFGKITGTVLYIYVVRSEFSIYNLYGIYAAPTSNGIADSITTYVSYYVAGATVKTALYVFIDYGTAFAGALIAETPEVSITSLGEITMPFSEPKPSVTANTNYYLCICSSTTNKTFRIARSGIDTDIMISKSSTSAFPNPLTGEAAYNDEAYIYCTYTEAVAVPMGLNFRMGIRGGLGRPPLGTGGASIGG